MDILTHTLSGIAVGTVIATYSSDNWKTKQVILFFSGLGAAFPDIDAISMWSRFDSTLGRLFGLENVGRTIYNAKYWYSHHGFMHSLLATFLFTILIGFLFWLFSKQRKLSSLTGCFYAKRLLLIGFISGFVIHLLQDMITPAGSWGGIRLFFPSAEYIGGTGDIWWWNNYNLFLVVAIVLMMNSGLFVVLMKNKVKLRKYTIGIFLIGCICFIWQMKRIDYNFNGKKYVDCEQESKNIQKEILGDELYKGMEKLDNALIIHF